jgi:hypothetical protein
VIFSNVDDIQADRESDALCLLICSDVKKLKFEVFSLG